MRKLVVIWKVLLAVFIVFLAFPLYRSLILATWMYATLLTCVLCWRVIRIMPKGRFYNWVVMVNYLMGHICISWQIFLCCSSMRHIIYSWQSYYVFLRGCTWKLSRKYVHSFLGEIVREARAAVRRVWHIQELGFTQMAVDSGESWGPLNAFA